jgi:multidrug resistance efflux pump
VAAQFSQTTRALARDTSRCAIAMWMAAGVCFAGWMLWFFLGSVTVYEVSEHARLEVTQAAHPIAPQVAGKIVSASLAMGTTVRAGDILVALDDSTERLRLREEQTRLDTIPRRIASLLREIESREREKASDTKSVMAASEAAKSRSREADAAAEFATDYERRVNELNAGGLVPRVDVNRAISDSKKAAASRDSLTSDAAKAETDAQTHVSQYDAMIEELRHSITTLEGDRATAQATVARLTVEIDKHVVRAPVSGRLGSVVPVPAGMYVAEGQQLATIVPSGELIVVADFSPSLTLGRVREGQQARVRLDGFPWAQYGSVPATVTGVATEVRDGAVRVELALDASRAGGVRLQHGLPGSVEVSVEQVSPASIALRAAGLLLANPVNRDPVTRQAAR